MQAGPYMYAGPLTICDKIIQIKYFGNEAKISGFCFG